MPDPRDTVPGGRPESLPFDEAIAYLRDKVALPTRTWTDIWGGMHARGFVVAGAMRDELLADFQTSLVKAMRDGTTLRDWRPEFERIVADWTGWTGERTEKGRAWRAKVIWDTNLRAAHSAGRWAQIQETKDDLPFLRYVAVDDARTRPQHRAWHGTTLPVDDPWWQTHTPPNGWYCRCRVRQLTAEQAGRAPAAKRQAPPLEEREVEIRGRGKVAVPKGIDPGFGHNPGRAAWGQDPQAVAMEGAGQMIELAVAGGRVPAEISPLAPSAAEAGLGPRVSGEAALRAALRAAIGGDERVLIDPTGGRVLVGQAIVDHMLANEDRLDGREAFFPLIPELIQRPQEIWIGFAVSAVSGRVKLRRRYVRLMRIDKKRTIALVADAESGRWVAVTFLRGDQRYLNTLRSGIRIFAAG